MAVVNGTIMLIAAETNFWNLGAVCLDVFISKGLRYLLTSKAADNGRKGFLQDMQMEFKHDRFKFFQYLQEESNNYYESNNNDCCENYNYISLQTSVQRRYIL